MIKRIDMDRFQIVIKGRIDIEWAEWFGAMEINYDGDSTILTGELPDQSALHGLLNQIRDLNLKLISVNPDKQIK
ncbi:hypothetical protein LH29_00970 [Draconibacterium sediminis]|uniref:Uncharacterized protein n=2 Tax=Draconibacterium sediminis TaxID=1544798 RepID=A0A0D8JC84_9BACT|nr:hypothetical protein LH29_00970 [Draconibacterium sediminis]